MFIENFPSKHIISAFENGFLQLFHTPYFKEFLEVWNGAFMKSLRVLEIERKEEFHQVLLSVLLDSFELDSPYSRGFWIISSWTRTITWKRLIWWKKDRQFSGLLWSSIQRSELSIWKTSSPEYSFLWRTIPETLYIQHRVHTASLHRCRFGECLAKECLNWFLNSGNPNLSQDSQQPISTMSLWSLYCMRYIYGFMRPIITKWRNQMPTWI